MNARPTLASSIVVLSLLVMLFAAPGRDRADAGPEPLSMVVRATGTLEGAPASCDSTAGSFASPAACVFDKGSTFTLEVAAGTIPSAGYGGWQSYVYYEQLVYKPGDPAAEHLWPDGTLAVRDPEAPTGKEGFVVHGDLTATAFPLPVSNYQGPLMRFDLNCAFNEQPSGSHTSLIYLLGYNESAVPPGNIQGAAYLVGEFFTGTEVIGQALVTLPDPFGTAMADVAAVLEITCGRPGPTPPPTATPRNCLLGDVDGDVSVSPIDATLILQSVAGFIEVSACPADVDGNGRVDALDASLILQLVAGLLAAFPA